MIQQFNTSEGMTANDKVSILLYGPPGSGKTWFGAHSPDPYIISIDWNGLIGIKKHKIPVEAVTVDDYNDVNTVIADIGMGKRARGRKTIVLDHMTELGELAKVTALRETNKVRPDLNVWGIVVDKIRYTLRQLLMLQKQFNIVVIAHEQIEKNELRGGIFGTPATIGKFAYHVGGLFDLFLYANQEVEYKGGEKIKKYSLYTMDYLEFKAKDRLGVLDVIEENDAKALFNKIYS